MKKIRDKMRENFQTRLINISRIRNKEIKFWTDDRKEALEEITKAIKEILK